MVRFPKKVNKLCFSLVMFAVVATVLFMSYSVGINSWWHVKHAIHDDACTLGHSLTMGLDFDLDYMNEVSLGKYANAYKGTPPVPPGIGVLSMPFVAAFSIFDRIAGHPVIQDHNQFYGSWSFFGVGFASSFYFLLGTFLYFRGVQQYSPINPLYCFFLCTGTGILYYVLMRPLMAHSFEYFNLAMNFYASTMLAFSSNKKQIFYAILVGMAVALSWLTRLHAIFPVMLPLIVILGKMLVTDTLNSQELKKKICFVSIFYVLFFSFAVLLMYGVYNAPAPRLGSYGNIYSYIPQYTTFIDFIVSTIKLIFERLSLMPIIFFGSSFPLWCFMPVAFWGLILLFATVIPKSNTTNKFWIITFCSIVILYIAGPLSAVLLWRMPGSAYGFRYLFPLVPLGFLGFSLWKMQYTTHRTLFYYCTISLLLVLSLFGTLAPIAFNTNPNWAYTYSNVNEFGLNEGANAKDNLFRTVGWLKHPSFASVAIKSGPLFAFLPKGLSNKDFIQPSKLFQIYALCGLWFLFVCFFVKKTRSCDIQFNYKKDVSTFSLVLLLFTIFLYSLFLWYQTQPPVESPTLKELQKVQILIENYKQKFGLYEVSADFVELDPSSEIKFLYKSDGKDYKLIALLPKDAAMVALFHPDERDPVRPWWAYGFWTPKARLW